MPEEMLNRLCVSKCLFAASEMQLQLFYSVLDQQYHSKIPQPRTTTKMLAELQAEYYGLPYVENTASYLPIFLSSTSSCYTFYFNIINFSGVAITFFSYCWLWGKILFLFSIKGHCS